MRLFVGTWNINGKMPRENLSEWLTAGADADGGLNLPDIYVVGLQEMVDLTATNVALQAQSGKRAKDWCSMLETILNNASSRDSYDLVTSRYLVGVLCAVFIKRKYKPWLRDVQDATAAVGVMGVMGNKGGAAIRFKLFDSSFCFICAHLAAHRGAVAQRNSDFQSIMAKTQFTDEGKAEALAPGGGNGVISVLDHDYVVFFGDFNYRIVETVSTEKCFELAYGNESDLELLRKNDQLNIERAAGRSFHGFSEGPLTFRPTYKFQVGTSLYEQRPEKKLRAPAWCDRVLWRTASAVDAKHWRLLYYGSIDSIVTSDHKPVHALFEVAAKTTVQERRQAVVSDVTRQLDAMENRSLPKVHLSDTGIHVPELVYSVPLKRRLTLSNVGQVAATWRFIPKPEEKSFCKTWLSVEPPFGMLPPGAEVQLEFTFSVDDALARDISLGRELAMQTYNPGSQTAAAGAGNQSLGLAVNPECAGGLLEDILILRTERGRDVFIPISAVVLPTAFGCSLEQLARRPEPMRALTLTNAATAAANAAVGAGPFSAAGTGAALQPGARLPPPNDVSAGSRALTGAITADDSDFFSGTGLERHDSMLGGAGRGGASSAAAGGAAAMNGHDGGGSGASLSNADRSHKGTALLSIPKEVWRLVDVLFTRGMNTHGIFMAPGDPADLILIREALDSGDPFPPGIAMLTYAHALVDLLTSLREPVVPIPLFPGQELLRGGPAAIDQWSVSLLTQLSPLRYNTLVYVIRFGREILAHASGNGVQADALAFVLSRCLMRRIPHDEAPAHEVPAGGESGAGATGVGGASASSAGAGGGVGANGSSTPNLFDADNEASDSAVSLVNIYADRGTRWEPTREEQELMTRCVRHLLTSANLAPAASQ